MQDRSYIHRGGEEHVAEHHQFQSDIMEVVTKPVYIVLGAISTICNLMILIFCLQDSDPLPNKYGESPKYCW